MKTLHELEMEKRNIDTRLLYLERMLDTGTPNKTYYQNQQIELESKRLVITRTIEKLHKEN